MSASTELLRLKHNYQSLLAVYRQGSFEIEEVPGYSWRRNNPSLPPNAGEVSWVLWRTVQDLYAQTERFVKQHQALYQEEAEFFWRCRVLYYELADYFMKVDEVTSACFIKWSEDIFPHIGNYIDRKFPEWSVSGKRTLLAKQLILVSLAGLNQQYRGHHTELFDLSIKHCRAIETFIRHDLPSWSQDRHISYGLLGLCHYIRGRLLMGRGRYQESEAAFTAGTEAYWESIEVKQAAGAELEKELATLRQSGAEKPQITDAEYKLKAAQADFEESRQVALRRVALAASLGSAYLAIVTSKVGRCRELTALARPLLKGHCGNLYVTYNEMLHCMARRAQESSDAAAMAEISHQLETCKREFERLAPDTHYVHKCGIECGIALCYLALGSTEPSRRKKFFEQARDVLGKAILYAEEEIHGKKRNLRIFIEAKYILSHVTRYAAQGKPQDDYLADLKYSLELATHAHNLGKGFSRHDYEASIAIGAVYLTQAQMIRNKYDSHTDFCRKTNEAQEDRKLFAQHRSRAQASYHRALVENDGKNPRVSATCYLALTELCLTDDVTAPQAHTYWRKWLELSPFVEHAFCHYKAEKLAPEVELTAHFLFIDPSVSLDEKHWQEKIREYLYQVMLDEIAVKYRQQNKASANNYRNEIVTQLMGRMKLSRSTAYRLYEENKKEFERTLNLLLQKNQAI